MILRGHVKEAFKDVKVLTTNLEVAGFNEYNLLFESGKHK